MLFEYAVEPEAIGSSWQDFRYLIEKFGFDRGRLISRMPSKWERKVIQAAKERGVPDIRLASIVERLRTAKLAVIDRGRRYESDKSWFENALTEHQRDPFHAIIVLQDPGRNVAVLPVADIDECQSLMTVAQDRAVPRDGASIAEALNCFLRDCARILFVDPFFDPYSARYKSTLRACLAVVKADNPNAACEIHYRYHQDKPDNARLETELAHLLRGVIPEGLAISIFCWREKADGADFHARYLLTERGGVGIDAGFSAEGGHQTTDMHLMSAGLSQARLLALARDSTEFELVEPVLEVRSDGIVKRV